MEQAVTKDMTIGDVVAKYPDAGMILTQWGLHCVGCHVNPYETIEQGSLGHGMTDEQIDSMVTEVNRFLSEQHTSPEDEGEEYTGEPVVLTPGAAEKLAELMAKQNLAGHGLRVQVMPGGCAGFSYNLDVEKERRDGDYVTEQHGITIFVDKNSKQHLKGVNVDYVDGLHGSGFKIENPNATSTCGCGKSFH